MNAHKTKRSTSLLLGSVLGLLLATATLTSCGGATATTAPAVTTTTSASTTAPAVIASTSSTTTTASPGPLADGEHFGFARDGGGGTLAFDPAEFLSGEVAVVAARAAGVIGPEEDLPNDFFISNEETATVRMTVDDFAPFTLIGFDSAGALDETLVSLDELVDLLHGSGDATRLYGFVPGDLPMTILVSGGIVVSGAQQYLP